MSGRRVFTGRGRWIGLAGLALVALVVWWVAPDSKELSPGEQRALDRARAESVSKEFAPAGAATSKVVTVDDAKGCLQGKGFELRRSTASSLVVSRNDVPRVAIRLYESEVVALSVDLANRATPGAHGHWVQKNNARVKLPKGYFKYSTPASRTELYACLQPAG